MLTPTRYDGYLALEAGATHLASYQPMLVPGLLQTEDYAHAVISQMRKDLSPPQVESLVRVRMERQNSHFGGKAPARLWAILDEAVLRRRRASGRTSPCSCCRSRSARIRGCAARSSS